MAILPIRLLGDPVLRKKAQAVNKMTAEEKALIRDMMETMNAAEGIGLAANQVGILKRVIVFRQEEQVRAVVNPRIIKRGSEQEVNPEGCLSIPGVQGDVKRYAKVVVSGRNKEGKNVQYTCEGRVAHCVQHEIDHLDGKLFIDRAAPETLSWVTHEFNKETGEEETKFIPTTAEQVESSFARRREKAYVPEPSEEM
jgi:peptide deformylase